MENKLKHSFSHICLYCLFFIGNTIINLPFKEYSKGSVSGFLTAFLLGFIVITRLKKLSFSENKKAFSKILYFFLCLYAVFCGLVTLRNFVTFSDRIILPEISSFFPTLLFLLLIWFILSKNESVILKLSLICFMALSVLVTVLFLFSFEFLSFDFSTTSLPTLKETGYQTAAYLSMSFLQGIILLGLKEKNTDAYKGGYILAGIFLFITLIQCIATFGFSALSELLNPYSSAVGIITFGDKFSRLEGFSYFIYFASTLIKTVICLTCAKNFFKGVVKKGEKLFLPAVLLIYLLISVLTNVFANLPFLTVAPFLFIPPIIFLFIPKKFY